MAGEKSKILFGLKNVHYAVVTETADENGAITTSYGDVKKWNGAVKLELSAEGSSKEFYADDMAYAHLSTNAGYSGSLESALVPDDVLINVFNMVKVGTSGIAEYSDKEQKYIALAFEISGDKSKRRYVFYRVALSRPAISSETVAEDKEALTQSCDLTATQRPDDYLVKYSVDEGDTAYADFFTSIVVPTKA